MLSLSQSAGVVAQFDVVHVRPVCCGEGSPCGVCAEDPTELWSIFLLHRNPKALDEYDDGVWVADACNRETALVMAQAFTERYGYDLLEGVGA